MASNDLSWSLSLSAEKSFNTLQDLQKRLDSLGAKKGLFSQTDIKNIEKLSETIDIVGNKFRTGNKEQRIAQRLLAETNSKIAKLQSRGAIKKAKEDRDHHRSRMEAARKEMASAKALMAVKKGNKQGDAASKQFLGRLQKATGDFVMAVRALDRAKERAAEGGTGAFVKKNIVASRASRIGVPGKESGFAKFAEKQNERREKEIEAEERHTRALARVAHVRQVELGKELAKGYGDRASFAAKQRQAAIKAAVARRREMVVSARASGNKQKEAVAVRLLARAQERLAGTTKKVSAVQARAVKQTKKSADATMLLARQTKNLSGVGRPAIDGLTEFSRVVAVMQGPLGPIAGRLTAMASAIRNMGVSALLTGLGIAGVVGAMKKAIPAAIDLQRTYSTLAAATSDATTSFTLIIEEARRTGQEYGILAKSYAQLAAAAKGSLLQGKGVTKIFKSINTASLALRLNIHQTAGALKAIEQMISKGTVSSEELRQQLGERLPGAFRMASDAMNMTTMEFSKAVAKGTILAEDLLPKLADVIDDRFGASAAKAGVNLGVAMEKLNVESAIFFGKIVSSDKLNAMTGAVNNLAGAVRALTDNIGGVAIVLDAVIVGALASGLGRIGKVAAKIGRPFIKELSKIGAATKRTGKYAHMWGAQLKLNAKRTSRWAKITGALGFGIKALGRTLAALFSGPVIGTVIAGMTAISAAFKLANDQTDKLARADLRGKKDWVLIMLHERVAALRESIKEEEKLLETARQKQQEIRDRGFESNLAAPIIASIDAKKKAMENVLRTIKRKEETNVSSGYSRGEELAKGLAKLEEGLTKAVSGDAKLRDKAIHLQESIENSLKLAVTSGNAAQELLNKGGLGTEDANDARTKLANAKAMIAGLTGDYERLGELRATFEAKILDAHNATLREMSKQRAIFDAARGSREELLAKQALKREQLRNRQRAALVDTVDGSSDQEKMKQVHAAATRLMLTQQKRERDIFTSNEKAKTMASEAFLAERQAIAESYGLRKGSIEALHRSQELAEMRAFNKLQIDLEREQNADKDKLLQARFDAEKLVRDAANKQNIIDFNKAHDAKIMQMEGDNEALALNVKLHAAKVNSIEAMDYHQRLERLTLHNTQKLALLKEMGKDERDLMIEKFALQNQLLEEQQKKARENLSPKWARDFGDAVGGAFESIASDVGRTTDAIKDLTNSIKRLMIEMLVTSPIKKGMTGLLSSFSNSILSGGGDSPGAISGNFNGTTIPKGFNMDLATASPSLPGFATGGSFDVGGSGGTDSQPVMFMATPGENVTVRTPQQQRNSGAGINQVFHIDARNAAPGMEDKIRAAVEEGAKRGYAMVADDFGRNGPLRQSMG